eukprot:TRINITY_DN1188_c0_g3_i1.p1 TRINITY_DN1188_c0_g3~~TRINITY_DN1188_c0_g3_i1.p1  ORF type:complete len:159 (+),score=28.75 TRINITY_DN1188_c0_g3_i1:166-642(+)
MRMRIFGSIAVKISGTFFLHLIPDDQKLMMSEGETLLDDCGRTLESYSIHEGSELRCRERSDRDCERPFRNLLNVYRKKKTNMCIVAFISFVKHASIHVHEVQFVRLTLGQELNHMKSLIHILIHSMPSLGLFDNQNYFNINMMSTLEMKDGFELQKH